MNETYFFVCSTWLQVASLDVGTAVLLIVLSVGWKQEFIICSGSPAIARQLFMKDNIGALMFANQWWQMGCPV